MLPRATCNGNMIFLRATKVPDVMDVIFCVIQSLTAFLRQKSINCKNESPR